MTTPEYIANPKDHPAHRGNTNASLNRPWYAPTDDLDRANLLSQFAESLARSESIAKALGTTTHDYEIAVRCLREIAQKEQSSIVEGCRL